MRLLARTGEAKTLVNLATTEWFHEMGDPSELKAVLEETSVSSSISKSDRFWTLDALAFWDAQDENHDSLLARVKAMRPLVDSGELGSKEHLAFALKEIASAGFSKDLT